MPVPFVTTLRMGSDNYSYLLQYEHDVCIVDACNSNTLLQELDSRGLTLRIILSTHHHTDHTAGNAALHRATGCRVVGADPRIAALTTQLKENDPVPFGPHTLQCMLLPGHTSGSCAYHDSGNGLLFTGDTLFYTGCGRMFEGTAAEFFNSCERIAALAPDTLVYCGHEYTLDNLAFARSVEPDNTALATRDADIKETLRTGGFSGPSTIALERATNPFLRTREPLLRHSLGLTAAEPSAVFAALRKRKDRF